MLALHSHSTKRANNARQVAGHSPITNLLFLLFPRKEDSGGHQEHSAPPFRSSDCELYHMQTEPEPTYFAVPRPAYPLLPRALPRTKCTSCFLPKN